MIDQREPDGPFVQNVTAVNGFAFGVIGADIHVFASGLPLYLLANWRPAARADRGWLRELPSRMLNARRAVVPFTGRGDELAQLRQWRGSGPRLAVRWLHGPGGQGKTRLAARFAAESAAAGWKVIAAFHGPDADPIEPGSQDMRLTGAVGLLVIIDYADRWLLTNLTWLFKNSLLHQTGLATRVLMVARTADAWPAVRGILDTYQAGTSSQHLPALAPESGERTGMFTAARDSFADIYQLPGAEGIGPPGPLDDPEFGLTLAVHMAALVAIDARATGQRPPSDMADLTIYLLDREQLHWARLYADGTAAADTAGKTYRTPPEVMNQAVFTAALTGTVTADVGAMLLENLQLPQPRSVLRDHAICYPPANPGRATALEPLYPDRLAEDFLALTMPGHPADYPTQAWAVPTATAVLARHGDQHDFAAWIPRAVTFLASAAHRWPHLGMQFLYPLLRDDPQLAVGAGSAALMTIADLPSIDMTVLMQIQRLFPDERDAELDPGFAIVTQRLADYRVGLVDDPEMQALIRTNLSWRLSNAGLHYQALIASEEAVALYRNLAETNPAAHEPDLAGSLESLGVSLSALGRHREALAASEQAVAIYRRLAEANPDYESDLAGSLNNLGGDLTVLGRHREALDASEQALAIYRRLAEANPDYESSLAWSLENLGVDLSEFRHHEKALDALKEALKIRRRMAEANPTAFEPDLAHTLSCIGIELQSLKRYQEALGVCKEAVSLYRRLAAVNPATFEPDLGWSLNALGDDLSLWGRYQEAVLASEEAVSLYRRLAAANPAIFEPDLANWLNNLAIRLSKSGRHAEALVSSQEAVAIYRRLTAANPTTFEPDLAVSLDSFASVRMNAQEELDRAESAINEAIGIFRRLSNARPEEFANELLQAHHTAVQLLEIMGRKGEAIAFRRRIEAMEISDLYAHTGCAARK